MQPHHRKGKNIPMQVDITGLDPEKVFCILYLSARIIPGSEELTPEFAKNPGSLTQSEIDKLIANRHNRVIGYVRSKMLEVNLLDQLDLTQYWHHNGDECTVQALETIAKMRQAHEELKQREAPKPISERLELLENWLRYHNDGMRNYASFLIDEDQYNNSGAKHFTTREALRKDIEDQREYWLTKASILSIALEDIIMKIDLSNQATVEESSLLEHEVTHEWLGEQYHRAAIIKKDISLFVDKVIEESNKIMNNVISD